MISIGWFHLPTYGVMLAMAIGLGMYTAIHLGRRVGVNSALILDYSSWVILVALVGAKVLMILTLWSYYRTHPEEIFSYATLKMAGVFYGGFLAALFFTVWYVRVRKISFWKLADVLAPSVALGTTVTRLGCFGAGCDYGKPTSQPWGVVFTSAFAHEATGVPLGVRLHPTQLYESLTTLALFALLLWWFPRKKRDGDVFLGYLGLYAVARFLIEYLRGDKDRGFVFHHMVSTSQFIALVALAGIAAVFIWRRFDGSGKVLVISESGKQQVSIAMAEGLTTGGASPRSRAGGQEQNQKAKRKTQKPKSV